MPKDPYCPLGFHPQVRWPTRCKRCFREYKEHISKKEDTPQPESRRPSASTLTSSLSLEEPEETRSRTSSFSSTSSTDTVVDNSSISASEKRQRNLSNTSIETSLQPPSTLQRRRTTDLSSLYDDKPSSSSSEPISETVTIRLRKTPSVDIQEKTEDTKEIPKPEIEVTSPSTTNENTPAKKRTKKKKLLIQEVKEVTPPDATDSSDVTAADTDTSADVSFIIQVKNKTKKVGDDDETLSMTTTTETDTTLVDPANFDTDGIGSWEVDELKTEVERLRQKCDKLEKEKSEILSRRVSSLDSPRVQSNDYTKLQQRVNQLVAANEDYKDRQKQLESKIRELETDLTARPNIETTNRMISDLRSKLATAEAQIDNLHEEKREAIEQMKDMQEEFEELQDSFREEQAEEFTSLKRELDDASKNCRLLQFKLRKTEKRTEQLEAEKKELEMRLENSETIAKLARLEEELAKAKSENDKLLKEGKKLKTNSVGDKGRLSPNTLSVSVKKKSPVLTKAPSGEKVDPPLTPDFDVQQTLRDLQSALERESDTREQLKFAEEETMSLRQKISRIEEENDSLLIQIKKMSSKPTIGKHKGTADHNNLDNDRQDTGDLKLQLELNEQECKILRKKVEELEKANAKLTKDLQNAETKQKNTPITLSKNVEEVNLLRRKLIEKEREVERLETELQAGASKNKGKFARSKSVESDTIVRLEADLKKAQAELAKLKEESDKEKEELANRIAEANGEIQDRQNKLSRQEKINQTLLSQVEKHQQELAAAKEHYENIQDDFVIKISQLQNQKEEYLKELEKIRYEHDTIGNELKTLRITYNDKQDTWIKEKLVLEEKLKEMEKNLKKLSSIPGDREAEKLRKIMQEQTKELETKRQELNQYKDRIVQLQKDNEDLRKNLEDYDKVAALQKRNRSNEPSESIEREIKQLRDRIAEVEKQHKTELAQQKMQHNQQIATMNEDVSGLQSQLSRAKRERDTYRQMVDSAQRAIAELKTRGGGISRSGSVTRFEEAATSAQAAVSTLQERVATLEDELAQAKREASRLQTEFVTEKSAWEMKVAEKQQKINELEEDRILSGSGSSRMRGSSSLGRTRIELAWQKEREEQQRRLKEATTLARDLKTTLLEIERERDRERLEAKRRLEQLKSAMEEEQEEMKRKVMDTQCDLLELRDAHAKLRSANEKLRKDRERLETEKEAQLRKELEMKQVRQEREKLMDELMTRLNTAQESAPTKSYGASSNQLKPAEILHYLTNIKSLIEPEDLSSRERKKGNFKRASSLGLSGDNNSEVGHSRESLASMPGYGVRELYGAAGRVQKAYTGSSSSSSLTMPSNSKSGSDQKRKIRSNMSDTGGVSSSIGFNAGSLSRKAVSLEQTNADEQKIWKGGSDMGSVSSIPSTEGNLSRGSSTEQMSTSSEKPKKKVGIFGKMKKLVKSKSIEESSTGEQLMRVGVQASTIGSSAGSDLSLNSETSTDMESGVKTKNKVKGIFKRGSRSRSPSAERGRSQTPTALVMATTPQKRSSTGAKEHVSKKDAAKSEATTRSSTPSASNQSAQRPLASQQRPLMPSTYSRFR